jgi:TatD DNase family protein
MYIDTHLHLADEQFDVDRENTIERARVAEVTTLVEIAESPDTWDAAIALADKNSSIYASLGIHPHHAHQVGSAEWPALEKRLRQLLQHPKVVALGEFGLDYFRMQNTKEQQDYLFRQQLTLAKQLRKPIVIHCRDAHADLQKTIAEFYPETSIRMDCPHPVGVIHCFSGVWSDAQAYLLHGFYLGIDAPVTYPSARDLQDVVTRVPVQRIVLETDSPYLPPQAHRGQRNEPAHIPIIAEAISTLKHKATADIAAATTLNARNLFRL